MSKELFNRVLNWIRQAYSIDEAENRLRQAYEKWDLSEGESVKIHRLMSRKDFLLYSTFAAAIVGLTPGAIAQKRKKPLPFPKKAKEFLKKAHEMEELIEKDASQATTKNIWILFYYREMIVRSVTLGVPYIEYEGDPNQGTIFNFKQVHKDGNYSEREFSTSAIQRKIYDFLVIHDVKHIITEGDTTNGAKVRKEKVAKYVPEMKERFKESPQHIRDTLFNKQLYEHGAAICYAALAQGVQLYGSWTEELLEADEIEKTLKPKSVEYYQNYVKQNKAREKYAMELCRRILSVSKEVGLLYGMAHNFGDNLPAGFNPRIICIYFSHGLDDKHFNYAKGLADSI